MLTCDLHVHSHFSDGSSSPEELIRLAKEKNVGAVALTDHHTMKGIPSFLAAAQGSGIEAVPGIEIAADYHGYEVHILGLFIPENRISAVEDWMRKRHKIKRQHNILLAENLQKAGYPISFEELETRFSESEINRAHFGAVLTEKGYTESTKDAIQTILSEKTGYYIAPPKPLYHDVIDKIRMFGGIAVLAHPLLNIPHERLESYLKDAKQHGTMAVEVYYSTYDENDIKTVRTLAKQTRLLESGGSDFHGNIKPDISLGTGKGKMQIPYTVYETLKSAANKETI